jgi:hypothetical protein
MHLVYLARITIVHFLVPLTVALLLIFSEAFFALVFLTAEELFFEFTNLAVAFLSGLELALFFSIFLVTSFS